MKMLGLKHVTVPIFVLFDVFSKIKVVLAEKPLIQRHFLKWTGKYGFLAKTTFIFEISLKRKKFGTVTCLKPDNFH